MPTLIVITGPTASGKSSLAILLAQHFSTEILSADSRQFYKGMDIGTAKPGRADLALVKHHFIDSHEISTAYNIGEFEKDALDVLDKIFKKKDVALLVGGSGLYIRAVCEGIDDIPGRDEKIRNDILILLEQEGLHALTRKLKELDPEYYNTVDLSNPHRIIRALEVCMVTGKKYSGLRKKKINKRPFKIVKIGLLQERDVVYQLIDERVDEMIEKGLLEEAKSLLPFRHMNALNTVGYKELFEYFDQLISLEEAVSRIKKNTRNYAKRQMTWLRKEEGIKWFGPSDIPQIIAYLEEAIAS